MRRSRLILLAIGLLVVVVGAAFINNYLSTRVVTVSYKNARDVTVAPAEQEEKATAKVTQSGQQVRLKKNKGFVVLYRGVDGYADGAVDVAATSKNESVEINPYYSEARLNSELDRQLNDIQQQIKIRYKNINLYEIQRGKLYHFGEWYATTLKHVDKNALSSDTLRIVLQKQGDVWVIKTDPPDISLSKFKYPDIPRDVLVDINNKLDPIRPKATGLQ